MTATAWGRLSIQAAAVLLKYADDPEVIELHKRLRDYEQTRKQGKQNAERNASRLADDGNRRDFIPSRHDHGIQLQAKGEGRTMTKKINTTHTGTRAEILDAMSSAYAAMFWADESKRYEFTVREIPAIGANLTFGDYAPMTDDEELTYAEVWENQQKFDNKRERAYLEPLDRSDVAGNEVQPVTLTLRETRAQEWLDGDDEEAQQYQAVKRAVVFEVQ